MNGVPISWNCLAVGDHRLACPMCSRAPRHDRTLGATVNPDGTGVAHCFRCEYVETLRAPGKAGAGMTPLRRHTGAVAASGTGLGKAVHAALATTPAPLQGLDEEAQALWEKTRVIEPSDAAGFYLRSRKCVLPPAEGDLRWLPAHQHPSGHCGPCLVALLTDALHGQPRSLHFTWIEGGAKANLALPRLLLKHHTKTGAVCRLWPKDVRCRGVLGICEGLETGLTLAHALTPVWACMDAGNLGKFPVVEGVSQLVIACDRDPAGEKAAHDCATRYAGAGSSVLVTRQHCNDLNDLVQETSE